MKPEWEKGIRGRVYAFGRSLLPLHWRRAIRRRLAPERLLGIRKPAIDIPHFDFDPNKSRPGRPDVLFLPVIAWTYRRQRPQQLAEALARVHKRVFYGAIAGPGEPLEATAVAPGVTLLPIGGVRREDPSDRRLEGIALRAAFESVARARDDYGMYEAAVVVESPYWAPLARMLQATFGWKIVYDCLDLHAGFQTNRAVLLSAAEEDLVREADLVVATSEILVENLADRRPDVRLLPNACDYGLFAQVPDPQRRGARLTVGYVGAVDSWFDVDLFDRLAQSKPEWTFEIVGGLEGGRRPASAKNVVLHGERPHAELPALRARFDVEIIPFRTSGLTDAVNPVKLYEAAAAGRPVVATPMRSLFSLANQGIARLATTPREFAREVEAAAAEGPATAARRRAFARENTWDQRATALESWIRELYPQVSIVIVTHNGIKFNRMCLESIYRHTDWPRCEVIFVDNGSKDGTAEWIASEARRRGPNLRLVALQENRGFAPAVNLGVASSHGEYLCLLNNDTLVTRGWLSALVRHLDRNRSLGAVGPSTNEIDNEAKVEVGYRDAADLDSWAHVFTRGNAGRADPIDMLAMFCLLVRRSVYEEIGPLDERFDVGMFEDDDYAHRLREKNYSMAVARDSFVHHWGRGSFRALPEQEYFRIYRDNRRRFEEKWAAEPRVTSPEPTPIETLRRRAEESGALFEFPPSIGWDVTLVQRPHHLARAIARRGFPVVFEVAENGKSDGTSLREIEHNLFLLSGEGKLLAGQAGRVVWAFAYNVPDEAHLAGARLVYDVIDHPDVFPYSPRQLRRNHERALRSADVVLGVSRPLLEEIRVTRKDALYVPNGVETERFLAPADPTSVPERLTQSRLLGRPVAGYVGAVARWFDAELLVNLARARADWDFFVIGEALDDSLSDFASSMPRNVIFAGRRPYAAVPSILACLDVGLIPFRLGPEGLHASPIKLYEYLAAGLPVISTPIPECMAIPEVQIAPSAEEFSGFLDVALRLRSSEDYRARARARARENDWSSRVASVLEPLGIRAAESGDPASGTVGIAAPVR
jgi:GT2 family glycosyltransferase